MKRDDEYIRQLLFGFEEKEDYLIIVPLTMNGGLEGRKFYYHVQLLCDQGYMLMISDSGYRLTSQGHDFLEAVRSDTIWEETKMRVAETGGSATLDILKSLALGFVKKQISDRTGIDL